MGCDRIWKWRSRSFGIALNALELGTQSGQNLGFQFSDYRFESEKF